ncbi:MAG TPA: hypothetical protein VFF27_01305 [Bacteroidia bacterium]|nr:hypothetical protein [Bacteroidia bacterium]
MKKLVQKIISKVQFPISSKLEYMEGHVAQQGLLTSGFSRAAATMQCRVIDESNPISWEFSAFSQSGEDGITEYLISKLKNSNRYFIEIGAANGIENNSAWLAHAKKFSGLMIDGNSYAIEIAKKFATPFIEAVHLFVNADNINELKRLAVYKDPDFFSLDLDGNDYYMIKLLLESGFKPKVLAVEYNSAYGPIQSKTIQYDAGFNLVKAHPSCLYYGVSITGWKTLLEKYGYHFITVDSNGVNAFFVDASQFENSFINGIKGLSFVENAYQMRKFKLTWEQQFEIIKSMNFFEIQ